MPPTSITRRQLVRLQTLWALLWARVTERAPMGDSRPARLAWVGGVIGRQIASCKELTRQEAEKAIDKMQSCLPPELVTRRPRRRLSSRGASARERRGTSGVSSLPRGKTLELIARFRAALGMDQTRFEAWLRSRHGPLRGRVEIRTERDAQAVVNALRQMLRRAERSSKVEALKSSKEPAEADALLASVPSGAEGSR